MPVQKSFSSQSVLRAAAASVFASSLAFAGNVNTFKAGTDLSTPENWTLGVVPTITDDAVISSTFPTAAGTLTLTTSATGTFTANYNSLNVTSSRAIVLENFSAANTNTATLTLGGAGSTTNSVAPSGADLLYVSGTSTLTLVSSATFGPSRLITAQSGAFNIAGTATLNAPLTVASGSTLTTNVTNATSSSLTLGGAITVGAGTTLLKTGAGTLTLTGTNSATFTGGLTVNAGLVEYGTAASAPNASAAVTLGGGTLQYSNTSNQLVTGNGRYNITLTSGTTSGLGTRNTTTNGSRLINAFGSGGTTISGAGNLTIIGSTPTNPSAVEFTTANTYTGSTNVGALQTLLLGTSALSTSGSAASSILNLTGGTLGVRTGHANGQIFAGVNIGVGSSVLQAFSGVGGTVTPATTGTAAYSLGGLTRATGGVADVFTSGVFTTTSTNPAASNIAGGYLTAAGNTTFATIGAGGVISAYSGYTAASADYTTADASTEFDATTTGTFTNSTVDSIRFAAAAPVTISPASTLAVASGGILVTPGVGANATGISGGSLTAGSGQELILHQWNNVAGGATTITSAIADNGSAVTLTKAGPGTVVLDGANTFTGPTYVTAGTLQVGNGDTLGGVNFAQPIINNGTLVFNRSDDVAVAGLISGTGTLLKAGTNVLTLSNANNSITGPIEIAQGVLSFANTLSLNGNNTTNRLLIDDGATLRYTSTGGFLLVKGITLNGGSGTINTSSTGTLTISGSVIPPTGGSGTLIKTGSGTLALSGSNTYTGVLVAGGSLRISATGGLGASGLTAGGAPIVNEIADNATLEFGTTIVYSGARNFQIDGPNSNVQVNTGTITLSSNAFVSGSGTLNKAGTGTLTLNTASSYTGGTIVKAGTLNGASGSFGSGDLAIAPTGTTAGGSVVVNSTGALASTANVTVNNNGVALGTLNLNDAAPVIGSLAGNGQVNLASGSTLTVGNTTSTTFSGVIAGSAGLTKVGSSTLSLTGANTYTGTTTLNGTSSTLSVKYASAGTSAATPLLSGAGGTDIQNGTVIIDYTGDTSPVAMVRSLLTTSFNETGTPGVMETGQIRSTTATAKRGIGYIDNGTGLITIRATLFGDADLDGGVSINDFNALAGNFGQASNRVWSQGDFDYDGGVSINDFNLLAGNFGQTLPASSEAWAGLLAFAAAHNDLEAFQAITGVPEPTSLGLIAAGATLGLRRRRRAC